MDETGVVTIWLKFEFISHCNDCDFSGEGLVQGYAQWDSSLIEGRFDGVTCTNIWKKDSDKAISTTVHNFSATQPIDNDATRLIPAY